MLVRDLCMLPGRIILTAVYINTQVLFILFVSDSHGMCNCRPMIHATGATTASPLLVRFCGSDDILSLFYD